MSVVTKLEKGRTIASVEFGVGCLRIASLAFFALLLSGFRSLWDRRPKSWRASLHLSQNRVRTDATYKERNQQRGHNMSHDEVCFGEATSAHS